MSDTTRMRAFALAGLLTVLAADAAAQTRTGSIAGRIILPDGAAAENARVAVYAVRGDTRTPVGSATSAHDGRYEIVGLNPGSYLLGVTPAGGVVANPRGTARPSSSETFYPDAADRDRAQRIELLEGVPLEGIDVWLLPAPQRYTVGGRVYMPDGLEPRQLVIEYGGPEVIRRGIWYVYDPGGLFEIEGVAQGPLVMLARADTDRGTYMGIASTIVGVESVQDVRITMRQPGAIEGRVVFERNLPRGSADLRISPVQTLLTLSSLYPVQDVALGGDGWFRIQDALGTYTFDVQGLPDGWTVKRLRRAGQPLPGGRLVVDAGETVTAVEVLVGPGSR